MPSTCIGTKSRSEAERKADRTHSSVLITESRSKNIIRSDFYHGLNQNATIT